MVCLSPVACSDERLTLETSAKTPYLTGDKHNISTFVDETYIQRTCPRRKTVFFKTSLPVIKNLILG